MARRAKISSGTTRRPKAKDNSRAYWLVGGVVAVCLILIYLFSRNPERERSIQRASQPEQEEGANAPRPPRTVKMRSEHGVYYIPARINGQELEFIFDTGASGVLISQIEATLLWKQGKLKEEDIQGEVQSSIADGSVVSNTAIILRTVEVAGVTLHDVEALVSNNAVAPLLLGQSVMSRFGSFTMDYNNSTVTFR